MTISKSLTTLLNSPAVRNRLAAFAPSETRVSPQIFHPEVFARLLYMEEKRAERSGESFGLMVLESATLFNPAVNGNAVTEILTLLPASIRESDICGWYRQGSALAVIFTEIGGLEETKAVSGPLVQRINRVLGAVVPPQQLDEIRISFRVLPKQWDAPRHPHESLIQEEFSKHGAAKVLHEVAKRTLDITGSLVAMILGLPLFLAVAIAVKATSRGPVLFRQKRIGQHGNHFTFFKFRSMYTGNDHAIHQEYAKNFIANGNGGGHNEAGQTQYKLVGDPRVTPVGRFIRRTSLDELPQFLNVLRGEMSLVGPRPPVPYEVECYKTWHLNRLATKPGITGLWQVTGRSRVKFDDMVRMDIRYNKARTIWLDIKLLLKTPLAVFSGNGAH